MNEKIILKCVIKLELNVQNWFRIRLSWLRRYTSCDIGERIVGVNRKQETDDQVQKGFGSDEVTYRSV